MLNQPLSYKKIKEKISVAESTASAIFRHVAQNAHTKWEKEEETLQVTVSVNPDDIFVEIDADLQALTITEPVPLTPPPLSITPESDHSQSKYEVSLLELISKDCLDPDARSGRPKALSEEEKDRLIATVKRDFDTRRMKLVDLRQEAGLSHVSDSTVYKALREQEIKAYWEEFKFILLPENKTTRLVSITIIY